MCTIPKLGPMLYDGLAPMGRSAPCGPSHPANSSYNYWGGEIRSGIFEYLIIDSLVSMTFFVGLLREGGAE